MHIDELERYWLIAVSVTLGVFTAALLASVFIFGVRLPSPVGRIDPTNLENTEFAQPGLRDMGNGQYVAHIVAQMWNFNPREIRVPVGSEVLFNVTSRDISHGFLIEAHNANLMLLPGQIAQVRVRFDRPGQFHIICHEYCGPGHQNMFGVITVEGPATAGITE
jgi:cytochrome c oxidase subunit 2